MQCSMTYKKPIFQYFIFILSCKRKFHFMFLGLFSEVSEDSKNFGLLRDFSSSDKMLVHLKLQICFVLPGLISAIRSLKKIHWNCMISNPWYKITYTEYVNSNLFCRNSDIKQGYLRGISQIRQGYQVDIPGDIKTWVLGEKPPEHEKPPE